MYYLQGTPPMAGFFVARIVPGEKVPVEISSFFM
jgi:hypothetical protein